MVECVFVLCLCMSRCVDLRFFSVMCLCCISGWLGVVMNIIGCFVNLIVCVCSFFGVLFIIVRLILCVVSMWMMLLWLLILKYVFMCGCVVVNLMSSGGIRYLVVVIVLICSVLLRLFVSVVILLLVLFYRCRILCV